MNIALLTNTFSPHVGGVARSVDQFAAEHRRNGHRVLVVAPTFDGAVDSPGVLRVPSIQNFNGSTFSLPLPIPGFLETTLDEFHPDIVHSNHPFLLGDTALRVAASRDIPVVFTHHTLYQKYTHYVIGGSETLKRFVADLAAGYGNLCDAVIAPSESLRRMLVEQGVERRIEVIPTGVAVEMLADGDGAGCRRASGVPRDAFVVGHVGRLAPEKNLEFLAEAVARFLLRNNEARFVVVGAGPCESDILRVLEECGVADRLALLGALPPEALADAYHAMDVFAFASLSETQGMVLAEAMAAGVPVVAVDGPGVRETVRDRKNGVLLPRVDLESFVEGLSWVRGLPPSGSRRLRAGARRTARKFSMQAAAERTVDLYESLIAAQTRQHHHDLWSVAGRRVAQEWKLWENMLASAGDAVAHAGMEVV